MKKFLVFLISIIVAILLGGVIGNLCEGIAALSWLGYTPPLHLDDTHLSLYIFDLTLGFDSRINICQLILVIVACFCAPKIASFLGSKDK